MQKRKSTTSVWLTDMVVADAIGRNDVLSFSVGVFLRTEIYLPVLDIKHHLQSYIYIAVSLEKTKKYCEQLRLSFLVKNHSCSQSYNIFSHLLNIIKQMLKTLLWNCANRSEAHDWSKNNWRNDAIFCRQSTSWICKVYIQIQYTDAFLN